MRPQSVLLFIVPLLASCGIGSEGVPSQSASVSEGLYSGTTSTGRTATGLVLDDGSFYVLYSAQNNPGIIAGAVQGSASGSADSLTSSNAKDINLENLGLLAANVTMTIVSKKSIKTTVTYPSLNQTITVNGNYDARYERTPSLSLIAGSYSGRGASPNVAAENATLTVSSTGAVTGMGSSGCTISGTVVPRTKGNAYDTSVKFGGAPCRMANATLNGVAYFDDATRQLYAIVITSGRETGFIFAGSKQ